MEPKDVVILASVRINKTDISAEEWRKMVEEILRERLYLAQDVGDAIEVVIV